MILSFTFGVPEACTEYPGPDCDWIATCFLLAYSDGLCDSNVALLPYSLCDAAAMREADHSACQKAHSQGASYSQFDLCILSLH